MADTQNQTPADAGVSAPPTDALANLVLDEVTGEKVSKTELKKRNKLRQKEAEKKEKAAAREAAAALKPAVAKKTSAADDEKELNPNVSLVLCRGAHLLMAG